MQYLASLSAFYADKLHTLMKSGRLPRVIRIAQGENKFKKPLEKFGERTI